MPLAPAPQYRGQIAAAGMAARSTGQPGDDNTILPGNGHRPMLEHIF
jgi:hypothetical protein